MPFPPKKSIQTFAKKAATPPMAAAMLAKKRAAAPPAPPPAAAAPPAAPAPEAPEEEQLMNMSELLEEAAQEAEAMSNPEIEDLIAGYSMEQNEDPLQPPEWAEDPELWEHVAKTVGLDVPELSARYEEPFAVAAYLYAKMGGPIAAGEEGSGEHEMGEESDMEKPGAAAKAMQAVLQSRPKVPAPSNTGA